MLKCQTIAIRINTSPAKHTYLTENISVNDGHFALFRPLHSSLPRTYHGTGKEALPPREGSFQFLNVLDRSKKIWYEMDKGGIERDGIAERKNRGRFGRRDG
jgi:hypothetical protein